ncbi:MAG: hypothetical protein HQL56_01220 [Magnetococcales bacterium]|nr:hypothetical protein [Magnetococcales bacterium]
MTNHPNRSRKWAVEVTDQWHFLCHPNQIPERATVIGIVTRPEGEKGVLVRFDQTGVLSQVNAGVVRSVDQSRVAAAWAVALGKTPDASRQVARRERMKEEGMVYLQIAVPEALVEQAKAAAQGVAANGVEPLAIETIQAVTAIGDWAAMLSLWSPGRLVQGMDQHASQDVLGAMLRAGKSRCRASEMTRLRTVIDSALRCHGDGMAMATDKIAAAENRRLLEELAKKDDIPLEDLLPPRKK